MEIINHNVHFIDRRWWFLYLSVFLRSFFHFLDLSSNRNTSDEQGMFFVSGMSTRIGSWGRYGSPFFPQHWPEELQNGRERDGFDEIYNRIEPNSAYDTFNFKI